MATKKEFIGVSKADIRQAVRNGATSGDVTKTNQARMILQEARKHGILNADEFEELKRENEL
jgi:uncharacterized membrane protein